MDVFLFICVWTSTSRITSHNPQDSDVIRRCVIYNQGIISVYRLLYTQDRKHFRKHIYDLLALKLSITRRLDQIGRQVIVDYTCGLHMCLTCGLWTTHVPNMWTTHVLNMWTVDNTCA